MYYIQRDSDKKLMAYIAGDKIQHVAASGDGDVICFMTFYLAQDFISANMDICRGHSVFDGAVERSYKLPSGSVISVSEDIHEIANALANRFYVVMGNISRQGFDYSKSPHPTEQMMYTMALECIDYESEYGF